MTGRRMLERTGATLTVQAIMAGRSKATVTIATRNPEAILAGPDDLVLTTERARADLAERVGESYRTEARELLDALALDLVAPTMPRRSPQAPVDEPHCTDLGNAFRFVARHGQTVRYVPAWGCWLIWDGRRWQRDETGQVHRLAWDTVLAIYDEAKAAGEDGKSERSAKLARHAVQSQGEARLRALLTLAEKHADTVVSHDLLDAAPWRLTVLNGTLDLHTGELQPHRREDLITKLVPIAYDPTAIAPRWIAFLDRVLARHTQLIDFLQRAVGYSLTGVTTEQCLFFLHGGGHNGKSVFLELLGAMLGEYTTHADFETFLERRSDGPRNDVARLAGARVVAAIEASEGRRLAEGLVKKLTGNDMVTARFLQKENFEYRPQFKLWWASNHKPFIRDTTDSTWRRIRLIPFTVQIPEAERDRELATKLRKELPGILRWAVEGCLSWQREQGLHPPDDVRDATAAYRVESDTLGAFLEECCHIEMDAAESTAALYSVYKTWADRSGEHPISQRAFALKLSERGFLGEKRGRGRERTTWRLGLRLIGDDMGTLGTVHQISSTTSNPPRETPENVPNRPQRPRPELTELPQRNGDDHRAHTFLSPAEEASAIAAYERDQLNEAQRAR